MENLFSILLLLACPIGMGLAMGLMMRGNQQQATSSAPMPAGQAAATPSAPALAEPVAQFQASPSGAGTNQTAVPAEGAPLRTENRLTEPDHPRQQQGHRGLCFNWKVVAGLAAVGLAIWVVAPSFIWAALPLLLLAACPISMLLMMRGMQGGQCSAESAGQATDVGRGSTEQIAALKAQMAGIQAQQDAIIRQLAELEVAKRPTSEVSPAGSKERVASGAHEQPTEH